MATANPRINVTFEAATVQFLVQLAEQQHKSLAQLVRELTLEALELQEDMALSALAMSLDKEGVKTYSHDDAWR